jgi:hypothetical protein
MYFLHKSEYRIFKPVEITIRRIRLKEKNRDGTIHVIIHICKEMSQGNSLCSCLKQTKMTFFFFYKMGEQEGETVLA